jgi:hypothetical protein
MLVPSAISLLLCENRAKILCMCMSCMLLYALHACAELLHTLACLCNTYKLFNSIAVVVSLPPLMLCMLVYTANNCVGYQKSKC